MGRLSSKDVGLWVSFTSHKNDIDFLFVAQPLVLKRVQEGLLRLAGAQSTHRFPSHEMISKSGEVSQI